MHGSERNQTRQAGKYRYSDIKSSRMIKTFAVTVELRWGTNREEGGEGLGGKGGREGGGGGGQRRRRGGGGGRGSRSPGAGRPEAAVWD